MARRDLTWIWWRILSFLQTVWDCINSWHGFSGKKLLIVSSGRSGSTLLRQYLNCHPRIHVYGELLEEERLKTVSSDPDELMLYMRASLTSLRGLFLAYTGFKLFNEQLERTGIDISQLVQHLNNPKVIVLYRRDLLETYVSLEIAFKNDCWYSETTPNDVKVTIDWDRFLQFADTERQRWNSSIKRLRDYGHVLFITFEELTDNRDETINRICQFLSLSPCPVTAASIRQNPQLLQDKVENFQYIQQRIHVDGDSFQLHFGIQE